MNYLEIGLLFFIVSLLASFTGRGGGLIYLSILIYFDGLSVESKILSFLLIIATSLPHLKKALKEIDKAIVYKLLLPSLSSYFLIGIIFQSPNGILFLIIILFIVVSSLLFLWFPIKTSRENFNLQRGKTELYTLIASGISAYVGLSPSLLLIPFLTNQLKMDMRKAILYLHFQNLIVVSAGLASVVFSSNLVHYPNFEQVGILIGMVLCGSYLGKILLVKSNLFWTKFIFTLLSIASLFITIYTILI